MLYFAFIFSYRPIVVAAFRVRVEPVSAFFGCIGSSINTYITFIETGILSHPRRLAFQC